MTFLGFGVILRLQLPLNKRPGDILRKEPPSLFSRVTILSHEPRTRSLYPLFSLIFRSVGLTLNDSTLE